VNGPDKPSQDIISLFEAILSDAGTQAAESARLDAVLAAAELSERLAEAEPRPDIDTGDLPALLAAYLDGGLDESERHRVEALFAASPADLHDAAAMLAHLDAIVARRSSAPSDLLEAAIAALTEDRKPQADIIPLRGPQSPSYHSGAAPLTETFQLLAAASEGGTQAIACYSQSGIWTLEVFVGQSERDQTSERGYLMLSVHPDHRATYEGRTARVFVKVGNEERVLAEENVRDGEVYAEISLAGLDLRTKDAINIVFGPAP
jgi:hypothetical protein